MRAFAEVLRRRDDADSVVAFFPREGTWTWEATIHRPGWPDSLVVRQFTSRETRDVIADDGEACESFQVLAGEFGPVMWGDITYLNDAVEWRPVSAERFVAWGDSGAVRSVFVEWRRESSRWVIGRYGDDRVEFPRILGVDAASGRPDPIVYGPAVLPLPAGTRFARGEDWFENHEPISYLGRRLIKYGLPRVLETGDVTRIGSYRRIGFYAETGTHGFPEVAYLPVSPTEFQPYQYLGPTGGCRARAR